MRTAVRAVVLVLRWAVGTLCLLLLLAPLAASMAGLHTVRVIGGSMRPTYQLGDVLIEQHPNGHDLVPGRIVTFRAGNGMVYTHRVVGTESGKATTKGDANKTADAETATQHDVIGTPWLHLPGAWAKVYLAIEKPTQKVALVIFMALAVLVPTPGRRRTAPDDEPEPDDVSAPRPGRHRATRRQPEPVLT